MNIKEFQGPWEIIETEMWEKEDLDLTETAYIQFAGDTGNFHFICVDGQMDVEYTEERAEFSWFGNDENDTASGRGWAVVKEGKLHGKIYFHHSDDSTFIATKM
jgi:hypothetical protein